MTNLAIRRKQLGLTQEQLGIRCGLSQADISRLETGKRSLSLDEAIQMAGILEVPLQWFVTGTVSPGPHLNDLALELRALGIVDLLVSQERIPGAFRPPEEVVSRAVGVERPDPRVLEGLPAILAWNRFRPALLVAFAQVTHRHALTRLAWLAEITLTIDRNETFPGGLISGDDLTDFLNRIDRPAEPDDLGHPSPLDSNHRVWKFWRVTYPASLETFRDRAAILGELRKGQRRQATD